MLFRLFLSIVPKNRNHVGFGGNTQKGVRLPHWVFSYVTLVPGYGPQWEYFQFENQGFCCFVFQRAVDWTYTCTPLGNTFEKTVSILNGCSEEQETADYSLLNKSQSLLGRVEVRKYVCKGNVSHKQPMFGKSESVGFYSLEAGSGVEEWEWLDWNTMRFKPVAQRSESKRKLRVWERGWQCGTINKVELKCCRRNVIRLQNCN